MTKVLSKSQTCSISEINTSAFYAEIQDSHQKWRVNDFGENSAVDSAHTLGIKNFVKIALSLSVSQINTFYAEIQDGHQKWQETGFSEKSQ